MFIRLLSIIIDYFYFNFSSTFTNLFLCLIFHLLVIHILLYMWRRTSLRWQTRHSQVLGNRSQSDLDDFQWFWDYCRKWKFKICSMSSGQLHVYVSVLKCFNLVINFDKIWPHCRGRGQAVLIIITTLWMASNPETPLPRPHPSPPTLRITITLSVSTGCGTSNTQESHAVFFTRWWFLHKKKPVKWQTKELSGRFKMDLTR